MRPAVVDDRQPLMELIALVFMLAASGVWFGVINAARDPRFIQLSLKLYF